jgi:ubiquinone biosynthesis protein UbiJ
LTGTLETFALGRLQNLINQALALDPGTTRSLQQLAGKTVLIESSFPPQSLALSFMNDGGITLSRDSDAADVALSGNPVSLALLMADASERVSFVGTGVTLRGDQEILRKLSSALQNLDIDWEQALAGIVGDTPAHLAGKAVRNALKWQRTAGTRAASGISEFFHQESGMALSATEAEPWFKRVRHLATDTDRLAARINRLRINLESADR